MPFPILCRSAMLAAFLGLTLVRPAVAERPDPAGKGDWAFELGAGALVAPAYEGSDEFDFKPVPAVSVSYQERLSLSFPDGLVWRPYDDGTVFLDLGLGYAFGRDEDDADALEGLGDLDGGALAHGKFGYRLGPVTATLGAKQDLSGDREGLTVTADVSYRHTLFGGASFLSVTPSLTWADDNYMQNSFGISPAQSTTSARGLARFDAESGLKDAGLSLTLVYPIREHIGLVGFTRYSRLLGDAADSPLVSDAGDENQFSGGIVLTYAF